MRTFPARLLGYSLGARIPVPLHYPSLGLPGVRVKIEIAALDELADYLRDHVAHDPQHCRYFTVRKTSVIR